MMSKRLFVTVSFAGLLAGLTTIGANAQTLSGKVSSAEEGLMEGVLVSAKKEGSTVTTTVVSNAKGEFGFPADRIEPGRNNVTIRAAGYLLAGPKQIDVAAGAPASAESASRALVRSGPRPTMTLAVPEALAIKRPCEHSPSNGSASYFAAGRIELPMTSLSTSKPSSTATPLFCAPRQFLALSPCCRPQGVS